jgi:hypothetical protein
VLFVPHLLVLVVWSVVVLPTFVLSWLAAVCLGRLPGALHRFLAAFLRASGRAGAWFGLLSGRYPSLLRTRTHPFRIGVPEPRRQRRISILLRVPLATPAVVLASVLGVIMATVAVAAWFTALVLGRTTAGLQELGTFSLRYELETLAYLLLLTPRYPRIVPPGVIPTPE